MERKTSLASGIEVTQDRANYDAACKRLLSEKIILAWIMRSCLAEYRDIDVNEIAEKYIEGVPFVSEVPVSPDETGPRIRGIVKTSPHPLREASTSTSTSMPSFPARRKSYR